MTHIQHTYAKHKLDEMAMAEDAAQRHAHHYANTLSGFVVYREGATVGEVALRSHQNLLAALQWSLDHQPHLALNISSALSYSLLTQGRATDAARFLELALAANPDPSLERAEALIWAAVSSTPAGIVRRPIVTFGHPFDRWAQPAPTEFAERNALIEYALERTDEAINIGGELQDPQITTGGWTERGFVLGVAQRYDEAGEAFARVLNVGEGLHPFVHAAALIGMANVHLANRGHARARERAAIALEVARRSHWQDEVWALDTLARIAAARGDETTAYRELNKAHGTMPPLASAAEAVIHTELGYLAAEGGELDNALHHFGIALAVARRAGNHRAVAEICNGQGYAELVAGRLDNSGEYHRQAAKIQRAHGDLVGLAFSQSALGHIALAQGVLPDALEHYRHSLHTWDEPNHSVAIALDGLAAIAAQFGDDQRAAQLFGAADAERDRIFYPPGTYSLTRQQREKVRDRLGHLEMDRLLASGRGADRVEVIRVERHG